MAAVGRCCHVCTNNLRQPSDHRVVGAVELGHRARIPPRRRETSDGRAMRTEDARVVVIHLEAERGDGAAADGRDATHTQLDGKPVGAHSLLELEAARYACIHIQLQKKQVGFYRLGIRCARVAT
jgi:hypothetical protein